MFDKRHPGRDERVVFIDKDFVTCSIFSSYSADFVVNFLINHGLKRIETELRPFVILESSNIGVRVTL